MKITLPGNIAAASAGILIAVFLNGCVFSGKILKNEPIGSIPDKPYEDIIILYTPDRVPLEPAAGYVYVEPGGNVKTDFAREEFVKVLPQLDRYAQMNRDNMGKFVIRDSTGRIRGYYEMLFDYRVHQWENGDTILLQIILPQDKGMKDNDFSPANTAPGGGK
ncbi:MAG: hypothetical protein EG826_15380 [Deltaproteobacteria bacterium]|nr:hypothetical protein [Deltaproteobacteria bacterium]